MARKQYTGAKLTILALAATAVMGGTAWLGANQPVTDTQAVADMSGVTSGASASTPSSTPPAATSTSTATATTTTSKQPATKAKKSRAS